MSAPQSTTAAPTRLERLCRKSAAGDVAALEELLWQHRHRLRGYAYRKIGED